jgi:branched-chain amino acid transport system substrate-binding protein
MNARNVSLFAFALALSLCICESSAKEDASLKALGDPIKIGHICDLTGVEAQTGEEARRSLEFAVEELGGVFGNHPVEIVVSDAQGQPSVAVDAARKMVERDGVVAVFGPNQAGHKAAVAGYMKEAGVPLIFYNGSPARLLEGNDWLVGTGGGNPQNPTVMADYAYNELGYRTVNMVSMDNVTSFRAFMSDFKKVFEARGGTVVQELYAPTPCTDWAPYLTQLKDADAIIVWTTGGDAIALWNAWHEMGISDKMPITAALQSGFTEYFILDALNKANPAIAKAVLGTVSPTVYAYDIQNPENRDFVKAWTKKFGAVPASNLSGQIYQSVQLLKSAIEALKGDTAPDKLVKALLAGDIAGPTGRLYFDNSNAAVKDIHIVKAVQMSDGSFNNSVLKTYKNVPPAGLK